MPRMKTKHLKICSKKLKRNVESGQTFAEALKKYPKQFDDLFVNMISAGEAGGILDIDFKKAVSLYGESCKA